MQGRRRFVGFGLTVLFLLFATPGSRLLAQDPAIISRLEARIAELEKRLHDLEEAKHEKRDAPPIAVTLSELSNTKATPLTLPSATSEIAPPKDTLSGPFGFSPAWNAFKDGFIFRSADNHHQLRITGQIQADYRSYPNHGDTADLDSFQIRRARLGIEATLFDHYEFRFLPDWGSSRQVIQDAYMNIHYWDQLQFQIGKFKEPVSYEQLIQDRFVPTLERSIIDQIVPARDVGMMIHGQKLVANRFDYAAGVFNGTINGDRDTNKLLDFAGRVAFRPFAGDASPEFLRSFQVGLSGTVGKEEEPIGPTVLRTPSGIPWLTFGSAVRADGIRTRLTPEVAYFYGPFGFSAQYLRMNQDMRSGIVTTVKGVPILDPVVNVPFSGFYFMTTILITGEQRTTFSQFITPARPFRPLQPLAGPGAWELVARVSRLEVGEEVFAAGNLRLANPSGNSSAATEMSLGFNWYLNSHVRMQFNWEYAWYHNPISLGTGTSFRQTNAGQVRFQIIF